jgi:opacity protein-like surface antigen
MKKLIVVATLVAASIIGTAGAADAVAPVHPHHVFKWTTCVYEGPHHPEFCWVHLFH